MKRMKGRGFGFGLLVGMISVALLWLLLLWGQLGRAHPNNRWIELAYEQKLASAANETRPKVLIVAGSGAMFGIDSGLLEQALGRPVVNLGVNAGLLSAFIIPLALPAIKPGDWVVMPLEYPLYQDSAMLNQLFVDFYLSHPLPVHEIGVTRWLKLLWKTSLDRVIAGYRGVPVDFRVEGLYGPHNLNLRGDQMHSETARREPYMKAAVEKSAPERYGAAVHRSPDASSWSRWRALAETVQQKGGCAVFMPPAMLEHAQYREDPVEFDYYSQLPARARAQGLVYAGEPLAFMYGTDAFFDTNFHLTHEARRVHTERLLAVLQPALAAHCRAVR